MSIVKKPKTISYFVVLAALVLMGLLHLATPFIAGLFSCLILKKLNFLKRKWLAVIIFVILICTTFYGLAIFVKQAVRELPDILNKAKPVVADFATRHNIDLPFNDSDSLKNKAIEFVKDKLDYLSNFAKIASKEFALMLGGIVIAIGIFINPELDYDRHGRWAKGNLYSVYCGVITEKFTSLFRSFELVMGAQLIISLINTFLTSIFVLATSLPYAGIVVALTFICGMLPIIGNVISNVIIVAIGFTVSPNFALWSILFLVGIHKLEYFLNSQIVGARIHNPMWLILVALIVGEQLMGIPGLILAPVILNFVKLEAIQIPADEGVRQTA